MGSCCARTLNHLDCLVSHVAVGRSLRGPAMFVLDGLSTSVLLGKHTDANGKARQQSLSYQFQSPMDSRSQIGFRELKRGARCYSGCNLRVSGPGLDGMLMFIPVTV